MTDQTDRAIVNSLQGGFPLTPRPFRDAGERIGLSEEELIGRIRALLDSGRLSRFGPLWNAAGIGGDQCLAAMAVPPERFEEVAEQVNAFPEVAHNYERAHALNMWFVISAERAGRIGEVIAQIERQTGLDVFPMPKSQEFFLEFRVEL